MKRIFVRIFGKFLASCVFVGLVACNSNSGFTPIQGIGTPSAIYEIRGKVEAGNTRNPVSKTKAVLVELIDESENPYVSDTVYANEFGEFKLRARTLLYSKFKLKLENGGSGRELIVDFKNDFQKEDGSLYRGKAEKDLGEIQLSKKAS